MKRSRGLLPLLCSIALVCVITLVWTRPVDAAPSHAPRYSNERGNRHREIKRDNRRYDDRYYDDQYSDDYYNDYYDGYYDGYYDSYYDRYYDGYYDPYYEDYDDYSDRRYSDQYSDPRYEEPNKEDTKEKIDNDILFEKLGITVQIPDSYVPAEMGDGEDGFWAEYEDPKGVLQKFKVYVWDEDDAKCLGLCPVEDSDEENDAAIEENADEEEPADVEAIAETETVAEPADAEDPLVDESFVSAPTVSIESITNDVNIGENKLISSEVQQYVVEGEGCDLLKEALAAENKNNNETVSSAVSEFVAGYNEDESLHEMYELDSEKAVFEIDRYIEPARLDNKVTAFLTNEYEFIGGAHGTSTYWGCNFDTATGEKLKLSDVFIDENAFIEYAKQYAINDIETQGEDWELYTDYRTLIDEVMTTDSTAWSLNGSGWVFIFNQYDIAPYSTGTIKFVIPYSDLYDYLKPEYMPTAGDCVSAVSNGVDSLINVVSGLTVRLSEVEKADGNNEIYLQCADDCKKVTDAGSTLCAYSITRNGKNYLALSYYNSDLVTNTVVYELTSGIPNSIYEVQGFIDTASVSASGFDVISRVDGNDNASHFDVDNATE